MKSPKNKPDYEGLAICLLLSGIITILIINLCIKVGLIKTKTNPILPAKIHETELH